ncbi:MAG: hypothetical protein QUS14_11850, partial [Pyrinomonadaceae bacterium]|nr:hypothetical protein [Pyrinomonadaceae bacterium]
LILSALFAGCGLWSLEDDEVSKPAADVTPKAMRVVTTAGRQDFLGCWSSGNGMVMRITEGEVFLSTNGFKPVSYTDESFENGTLVIRLNGRPEFYCLAEFVSLEFDRDANPVTDFPLVTRKYQSLDDLKQKTSTGSRAWVKGDCEPWFPQPKKR